MVGSSSGSLKSLIIVKLSGIIDAYTCTSIVSSWSDHICYACLDHLLKCPSKLYLHDHNNLLRGELHDCEFYYGLHVVQWWEAWHRHFSWSAVLLISVHHPAVMTCTRQAWFNVFKVTIWTINLWLCPGILCVQIASKRQTKRDPKLQVSPVIFHQFSTKEKSAELRMTPTRP